jgi:hypothetical protein
MEKPEGMAATRLEQLERYFNDQMSGQERAEFEAQLNKDQELRKDWMVYKSFFASKSIRLFRGDISQMSALARRKLKVARELVGFGLFAFLAAASVLGFAALVLWFLKN